MDANVICDTAASAPARQRQGESDFPAGSREKGTISAGTEPWWQCVFNYFREKLIWPVGLTRFRSISHWNFPLFSCMVAKDTATGSAGQAPARVLQSFLREVCASFLLMSSRRKDNKEKRESQKYLRRNSKMFQLGRTSLGDLGSAGITVGLCDLSGLFQPKRCFSESGKNPENLQSNGNGGSRKQSTAALPATTSAKHSEE